MTDTTEPTPPLQHLRDLLVHHKDRESLKYVWNMIQLTGAAGSITLLIEIIECLADDITAHLKPGAHEVMLEVQAEQLADDLRKPLRRVLDLIEAWIEDKPDKYTATLAAIYSERDDTTDAFGAALSLWSNVLAGRQHNAVLDLREETP